jgi:hypothetical protein
MHPGPTENDLTNQLLQVANDPDLRQMIYERLGEYCHQCRNRLNSLKLGLYLVARQSCGSTSSDWSDIERHYRQLERRVIQIQTLCRPMSLSRVTLGIDLLIEDRQEAWTRLMESNGKSLEFVAPAERAIASFDVERLGEAMDSVVAWRALGGNPAGSARLRWWVEAGYAHVAWEESPSGVTCNVRDHRDEVDSWALPMLARIALAHGGDYRVQDDHDWKLEVSWPSSPPPL